MQHSYDLNKDNDHNAQGGRVGEVEVADHDGPPWRLLTFLPPPLHRCNCSQVTKASPSCAPFQPKSSSRATLIVFSVCGLFSIILLWLLASIYVTMAVALADFCYRCINIPSFYISSQSRYQANAVGAEGPQRDFQPDRGRLQLLPALPTIQQAEPLHSLPRGVEPCHTQH